MRRRLAESLGRAGRGERWVWLLLPILAGDAAVSTWGVSWPNGSAVPYWALWLVTTTVAIGVAAAGAARLRPSAPRLRPVEALAIAAVLLMVMTDVTMLWQPLRDLGIYLKAGHHFLDGSPVYMQTPLTTQPDDRTAYPFLYPPLTLPLFGLLAVLPEWLARAVWVALSVGLAVTSLRLFGVPWRWAVPALLWPPFFEGVWVGNVAVPALALFAIGPRLGASLVLGAVFKPYTGLAALWLALERRWRQLLAGIATTALFAAATLPLTGTGAWSDWLDGLRAYQGSQPLLPGLYGFGLPRYFPYVLYVALAVAAVVAALRARGREALARFGVATVVASPSLFGHGLLVTVPAMLRLRGPWLWLALGLVSLPHGPWLWLGVAVVAASWLLPSMAGAGEPWPGVGEAQKPAPAS